MNSRLENFINGKYSGYNAFIDNEKCTIIASYSDIKMGKEFKNGEFESMLKIIYTLNDHISKKDITINIEDLKSKEFKLFSTDVNDIRIMDHVYKVISYHEKDITNPNDIIDLKSYIKLIAK